MKRFYSEVAIAAVEGGFQVALDGRGIRTQGGAAQVVPNANLAEMLAEEWRSQGKKIDPKSFVYRDLADFAIDHVRRDRDAAIAAILPFAQTDTLCYRADPEDALFRRQEELWEPLVTACETRHCVTFRRVSGIVHRPQDPATMERLRGRLEELDDFSIAAVHTLASLAASLIGALAVLEPDADPVQLFAAANCEEDWQAELWGWDAEAEKVRATRLNAFEMAARFAQAAHG